MKKILFGFAFLAGLASCSKDEPTNGGENTENGKYKLYLHYKADYSSSEDRDCHINCVMTKKHNFVTTQKNYEQQYGF